MVYGNPFRDYTVSDHAPRADKPHLTVGRTRRDWQEVLTSCGLHGADLRSPPRARLCVFTPTTALKSIVLQQRAGRSAL